jgi:hypothetical protein
MMRPLDRVLGEAMRNYSQRIARGRDAAGIGNEASHESDEIVLSKCPDGTFRPNPINHLLAESLQSVREKTVRDPQDSVYQFSRKVSRMVLGEPSMRLDQVLLEEGIAIGLYKILEWGLNNIYRRQG